MTSLHVMLVLVMTISFIAMKVQSSQYNKLKKRFDLLKSKIHIPLYAKTVFEAAAKEHFGKDLVEMQLDGDKFSVDVVDETLVPWKLQVQDRICVKNHLMQLGLIGEDPTPRGDQTESLEHKAIEEKLLHPKGFDEYILNRDGS